ncbi:DNA primase small subunit domain-containing protein [Desulfurococcus mucosus]|uniref:DNA primase small subunit PriS n=1 Tax=Desulfurococcus mucosus (strain ATCC 35584 / DSM 2162 / JCM 9187 / O7/1) TaxID=765177 RepID=E8RAF4_DESM0|nr:DNA primase small subunit domain-containing protein [Desulfurococcus mucosus]ADV64364.1 DNA primase small subunit [Desulfurococcus mucosus DSM 2162]
MSLHARNRRGFLRRIIWDYYRLKPLEEPSNLHMREVALESLEDGKYIRHLSFPYMEKLYEFIQGGKTPLHLYYSSALYSDPSAEDMESKGWQGSELIFDIDADKYPGCSQVFKICIGGGVVDGEAGCPGGREPVEYPVVPWDCIRRAWESALRLRDILLRDLGFSRIKIYFSGNRGFHVRVLDESALPLTREQRRLLADYVACSNLDTARMFPSYRGKVVFHRFEHGLRRRVLESARARGLVREGEIAGLKGLVLDEEHLPMLLEENCIGIDKVVTIDTSRLSRFGNSLNMKSGLRVTEMDPGKGLDDAGFTSFSPFKGGIRVKSLIDASRLPVLDKLVDLKKGGVFELEAPYAIYLIIHGVVDPVEAGGVVVKP